MTPTMEEVTLNLIEIELSAVVIKIGAPNCQDHNLTVGINPDHNTNKLIMAVWIACQDQPSGMPKSMSGSKLPPPMYLSPIILGEKKVL